MNRFTLLNCLLFLLLSASATAQVETSPATETIDESGAVEVTSDTDVETEGYRTGDVVSDGAAGCPCQQGSANNEGEAQSDESSQEEVAQSGCGCAGDEGSCSCGDGCDCEDCGQDDSEACSCGGDSEACDCGENCDCERCDRSEDAGCGCKD